MQGSISLPFSVLFTDTINTHGTNWSYRYYVCRNGMSDTEFWLWVRIAQGVQS